MIGFPVALLTFNAFHDEGYRNSMWKDQEMFNEKVALIAIAETNPLGMALPAPVERVVNRLARRLLPKAYAVMDAASATDAARRTRGEVLEVAGVA